VNNLFDDPPFMPEAFLSTKNIIQLINDISQAIDA
jgi:hypothetical protein